MFNKVLIANRGEIACRIIRTLDRLGIASVAVYSEADAHSKHVLLATEAVCIGAAPASESYLRSDRILEVARQTGAAAVIPAMDFEARMLSLRKLARQQGLPLLVRLQRNYESLG